MLMYLRNNMQSTMAKIIVAIMIVPFALFGVESFISSAGGNDVAVVNGDEITLMEFTQALNLQKRRILAQMGENADPTQLDDELLRAPVIDSLVQEKLMVQAAEDAGLYISEAMVNEAITDTESFQQNGVFSADLYRNLLASNGFTPTSYKELLNRQMLINQLNAGLAISAISSDEEMRHAIGIVNQERTVRYMTLPLKAARDAVELTEEDVQQYYESQSQDFMTEEMVSVEYLELKQSDYFPDIDAAEVRSVYERELNDFNAGIQRQAAHILLELTERDEDEAIAALNDLKVRIDAGEDFAELAAEFSEDIGSSEDGGDLGYTAGDSFPEEFESALAALEVNQVSAPVVTEAGVHLIKLLSVEEDTPPSFEDREADITRQLQLEAAEPEFVTKVEQLADLSFNSIDLQEPAEEVGATVKTSALFGRQGGAGLFANSKLVREAFSEEVLAGENNSEVIEISSDHVVVIRLKEHKMPELKPLADVEAEIRENLTRQRAVEQLSARSESLLEQLRGGAELDKLAVEHGYEWQVIPSATRRSPGNREVLNKAFSMPASEESVFDYVVLNNSDVVVLSISDIKPGKVGDLKDPSVLGIRYMLESSAAQTSTAALQESLKNGADIDVL